MSSWMHGSPFVDRRDAGRELAVRLRERPLAAPLVVALPRGGVPVAYEVARALHAPLTALVVRKIGAPFRPELGVGAIAEGGEPLVDGQALAELGLRRAELDPVIEREAAETRRRVERYRAGRPFPTIAGGEVVLVDDGIATGGTVRAAVRRLRDLGASRIVLATPVAASQTLASLAREVDETVCLVAPEDLVAIGYWYEDFSQVSDSEVLELLEAARLASATVREEIEIEEGDAVLHGDLAIPNDPRGLVIFAHGSGSGRHSPRNRQVASALQHVGFATLLLDLLTPGEALDRGNVFDIELLARRLAAARRWAASRADLAGLAVGYFGASTGAAAALRAAAAPDANIAAIVSRGGRPDLAANALARVAAPTLLVVGGEDRDVLALNEEARRRLRCRSDLRVVPGATHLFEEPGTLEQVARFACEWFLSALPRSAPTSHESVASRSR